MERKRLSLNRRIMKDDFWRVQQLSSNALTLAGFSFASLAFLVGYLGKAASPIVIIFLLSCTIVFAISGEMARNCYTVYDYVATDTLYLVSLVMLFSAFIIFTFSLLYAAAVFPIMLAAIGMLYLCFRAVQDFKMMRSFE